MQFTTTTSIKTEINCSNNVVEIKRTVEKQNGITFSAEASVNYEIKGSDLSRESH